MNDNLENIKEAYEILKEYNGDNPFIIRLKNSVYAYANKSLTSFDCEYIIKNHSFEPIQLNKTVIIAEWFGKKKQEEWNTEFIPQKLYVTWLLGETNTHYHFFCIYRRSLEKAVEVFAPKDAILTELITTDWKNTEIDFTPYEERSGRQLYDHQKEAVKFLNYRKKGILALEMGYGKCEPLTAEIPTPNGFVKMGDIKIGDKIFGSDGKAHNVLGVYPQGKKKIYKVHFSDHTYCRCGEEHLWIVKKCKTPKNNPWKVMSLKEIMSYGIKNPKNEHENYWKIPICEPIEYEEVKHFINPYLLGIMIGDGNLCSGGICISIPDSEKETVERINEIIGDDFVLSENRSASCPRYTIKNKIKKTYNIYNREIKRLGLNVKGDLKFIPNEYKIDSIDNRLSLLQGLLDSDGTIGKNNRIHFSTSSEQLANDVKELVYSLGGRATLHKYERKNKKLKKDGTESQEYQVLIQIKMNPFKLSKKSEKYHPTFVKYCSKYICKIEEDGEEEAQCIYVDSKDHSYLTSHSYIVTHNTTAAIVASLVGNYEHILVVCPSSVKKSWENELKLFVDEDDITIVQGSTWKNAKYTIINYDILDNFYTIPTQKVKKKEIGVDDDGNIKYDYVEKEIVSRSKKIINDAMADSQLFQANYDLIIIDEAHRLSNNTSNRFKIISDLVKRSKPNGIFELTGTMITNSSKNLYNLLKIINVPITKNWEEFMKRYCGAKIFYKKNEKEAYTTMFLKSVNKNSWYDLTYEEKQQLDKLLEEKCKKICIPGEDSNMDELREIIKPYYMRRTKDELEGMVKKNIVYLHYEMTSDEKESYDNLWEEYLSIQEDKEKAEKYKKLEEVSLMRQWLADKMIPKTIKLAKHLISKGHKIIIFCAYDNEINKFVDEFKDECVYHNGKVTEKNKNKAVDKFMTDDNIKVFVGNLQSAGVGLTLTSADTVLFNNFSFVPSDNLQAEDRIHRLNQTKPCTVYYQSFNGTYFDRMLEIVHNKQEIIDKIIITEKEKQ